MALAASFCVVAISVHAGFGELVIGGMVTMGRNQAGSLGVLQGLGPTMTALGQVFADAFAKYTVEVLALAKERNILDLSEDPADAREEQAGVPDLPNWVKRQRNQVKKSPSVVVSAGAGKSVAVRNRIVMELRARGMTQADLARQMHMKPSSLSRVLQATERSRVSTLKRIASVIHVDISELL